MITYAIPLQPTESPLSPPAKTAQSLSLTGSLHGCRSRLVQSSGMYSLKEYAVPPALHLGSVHAPLTSRQLSVCSPKATCSLQSLSHCTSKYTKPCCFCQEDRLFSFLTYCDKVSHTPFFSKSAAAPLAPFTIFGSYPSISRSWIAFRDVVRPF